MDPFAHFRADSFSARAGSAARFMAAVLKVCMAERARAKMSFDPRPVVSRRAIRRAISAAALAPADPGS